MDQVPRREDEDACEETDLQEAQGHKTHAHPGVLSAAGFISRHPLSPLVHNAAFWLRCLQVPLLWSLREQLYVRSKPTLKNDPTLPDNQACSPLLQLYFSTWRQKIKD